MYFVKIHKSNHVIIIILRDQSCFAQRPRKKNTKRRQKKGMVMKNENGANKGAAKTT